MAAVDRLVSKLTLLFMYHRLIRLNTNPTDDNSQAKKDVSSGSKACAQCNVFVLSSEKANHIHSAKFHEMLCLKSACY